LRELLTIYRGLQLCCARYPDARHLHVVAYTDNAVSAAAINTATSKSDSLLPLVEEIGLYQIREHIMCSAVWIPGRELIIEGDDPLWPGAAPRRGTGPEPRGPRPGTAPEHRGSTKKIQNPPDLFFYRAPDASSGGPAAAPGGGGGPGRASGAR
jgi:hypothetical protein